MRRPWRHKIDLKQYISQEIDQEATRKAADGCRRELRRLSKTFADDQEYLDIVDQLGNIVDSANPDVDDLNDVLSDLYEWADDRRVWLGP